MQAATYSSSPSTRLIRLLNLLFRPRETSSLGQISWAAQFAGEP